MHVIKAVKEKSVKAQLIRQILLYQRCLYVAFAKFSYCQSFPLYSTSSYYFIFKKLMIILCTLFACTCRRAIQIVRTHLYGEKLHIPMEGQ